MTSLYTSQLGEYTKLIIPTMNFTHLDVVHKLTTQTQCAPGVLSFYTQNTAFYESCLRTKDPNAEEFEVWLTGLIHLLNSQISKNRLEDLASKRSGGARQMRNYLAKWVAQHNAPVTTPAVAAHTPKVATTYDYYSQRIAQALDYVITEVSKYMYVHGSPLRYPVTPETTQVHEVISGNVVNLHRGITVKNPQGLRGMTILNINITLDNLKVYSVTELMDLPVSIRVKSDNTVGELWLCKQKEKEKIITMGTILKAYSTKDVNSFCKGIYGMHTKLNEDNITSPPTPKKTNITVVPAINKFRLHKFLTDFGTFFSTTLENYLEEAQESNLRTHLSNWDVPKSSIKDQKIEDMEALFKHIRTFIDDLWGTYSKEISFEKGANDHLVDYLTKLFKAVEDTTNDVQRRTIDILDDASVNSDIYTFYDEYGDPTAYEKNFINGVFNEFAAVLHEIKQDYKENEDYYRNLFREPQQPGKAKEVSMDSLEDIAVLFHL